MPSWNEHHYARSAEFVRLVAEAVAPSRREPAVAPAPAPVATSPLAAKPFPPLGGRPVAAPAAAAPAPAPAPAAEPAEKPTAASVFKKMPWKK